MSEPNPGSPDEPRKGIASFLPIILILAAFFLIVLIASLLLLPDRGRRLLKLSATNPVTQTLAMSMQPDAHSLPLSCRG